MQTFLPVPSFEESARILDYRRLGKQRVEAKQILDALTGRSKGWVNHPATLMWKGYEDALAQYMTVCIDEWIRRGYKNTMATCRVLYPVLPPWVGDLAFHAAHRSNLLRKAPDYYSKFGWSEGPDLPYIWPKA